MNELRQMAQQLRAQIEAEVEGFAPDEAARAARRARAEWDFRYFGETYFPHYVRAAPSTLHEYFFERVPQVMRTRGNRDATAAPRGEAKTTWLGIILFVWMALYRKRHYPVVIMDAVEQALETLESIKAELEFNPRIRNDFPEAAGEGRVWKIGVVVTRTDVKIEAFGAGKRIRGRRHGPHRPDFVLLDDIENDENVRQVAQRDKLEQFIDKTVIPLGGADDSIDVWIIGTVLRLDSVLDRKLRNPLWRSRRFQGLVSWPDRMDLWDRWEEILRNTPGEPEEKLAAAHAFYEKHRAAMDRGARTSWPAVRSLESLMVRRARDGHAAFDSEIQNDPGAESRFFVGITFWVDRSKEWVFFGACDPSLGKHGGTSGDPSAVLVGGYQRAKGILDVVEASIARRLPLRIIQTIIAFQREYGCVAWAFESVQFQEFMRQQLIAASVAAHCPVPARPVIPIADKDLRIESLQPFVERGLIRLHPSLTELRSEMQHYPHGDHVDGLDALQMLWMLATTSGTAAGATREDATAHAAVRARRSGNVMFGRRVA